MPGRRGFLGGLTAFFSALVLPAPSLERAYAEILDATPAVGWDKCSEILIECYGREYLSPMIENESTFLTEMALWQDAQMLMSPTELRAMREYYAQDEDEDVRAIYVNRHEDVQ